MNCRILVIMAGGKSSRMQTDKALLPFKGYNSLAQYQYERLKPFFSKIYLSAKENKFDFEVEMICDISEESSPLVALVSIFETLKDLDEVAILSVDAPFVDGVVFERLWENLKEDSDAIVSSSPNGLEPLCAIYRRTILATAKEMLAENRHRLQTLLERVQTQKLLFLEEKLFMNLNYPFEFESAKKSSSNI